MEQANDLPPTPSFFHTSLCVKMPHGKPARHFLKALHGYIAFRVFRVFHPTWRSRIGPTFGFEYPVDLHYTPQPAPHTYSHTYSITITIMITNRQSNYLNPSAYSSYITPH